MRTGNNRRKRKKSDHNDKPKEQKTCHQQPRNTLHPNQTKQKMGRFMPQRQSSAGRPKVQ
jgi:hypothetical protein